MPVGAGSIKRAAKKAADLEEVKEVKTAAVGKPEAAPAEESKLEAGAPTAEAAAPAKKSTGRKTTAKKPAVKKAAAGKNAAEKPAEEVQPAPAAEKPEGKAEPVQEIPAVPEGVRSMRDGALIANESDILGENKKVEVLQEMPVYLL